MYLAIFPSGQFNFEFFIVNKVNDKDLRTKNYCKKSLYIKKSRNNLFKNNYYFNMELPRNVSLNSTNHSLPC